MESSSGSSSCAGEWKAEEAIAGNAEALRVLRELITYPLLYSAESRKLGLKVLKVFPDSVALIYSLSSFIDNSSCFAYFFCSGHVGCCYMDLLELERYSICIFLMSFFKIWNWLFGFETKPWLLKLEIDIWVWAENYVWILELTFEFEPTIMSLNFKIYICIWATIMSLNLKIDIFVWAISCVINFTIDIWICVKIIPLDFWVQDSCLIFLFRKNSCLV